MGWDRELYGFDQSMADAQWDDDPANPANEGMLRDQDYEYDAMMDDLAEHNATICNPLGAP